MNRAARRAFAKRLSTALGRETTHRPSEPEGPTAEERLERLEARNAELEEQLQDLRNRHDQVPGVTSGRKDWHVLVGSERVDIRAIPPAEWLKTVEELPEFLFAFALERTQPAQAPSGDTVAKVVDLAKRWITASAVKPDDLNLDRLTVPEAEHAVAQIAELNGVTAHLAAWFRQRLQGVATAPRDSQSVRSQAVKPPGSELN